MTVANFIIDIMDIALLLFFFKLLGCYYKDILIDIVAQ